MSPFVQVLRVVELLVFAQVERGERRDVKLSFHLLLEAKLRSPTVMLKETRCCVERVDDLHAAFEASVCHHTQSIITQRLQTRYACR